MTLQRVLVTGGAGYIGSHAVVQLLNSGFEVFIYDNFSNSCISTIDHIGKITGKKPSFVSGDIRDRELLKKIFSSNKINSVMHFAGLKAVGESEAEPMKYYDTNVAGSLILLEEALNAGIEKFIFSSSATVYGQQGHKKYREDMPLAPVNVYGNTKFIVEKILRDLSRTQLKLQIAILRYFNPVGAHKSGLIGEAPKSIPNNLMPYILQVASGRLPKLFIFGDDYPTLDGTGMRDFIHVDDLVRGHILALETLSKYNRLITVNLGTGNAFSVLQLVKAFEKASGISIPYEILPRRSGDLAEYYADTTLAKQTLNWHAELGLDRICEDAWRYQKQKSREIQ